MSKFLKCVVCVQSSTKHLFSLQCLHLICRECIEDEIKVKRQLKVERNKDFYFSCPTCEYPSYVGRSEVLALKNFCKVPHILKTILSLQSGRLSPNCVVCKTRGINKMSSFWCFQCVEYFCEDCLSLHTAIPNMDNHSTYSIEELKNDPSLLIKAREQCDVHDMHLTKLCTAQGVVCCDSCISSDHTDVCKGEHKHIKEASAKPLVDSKLEHLKASLSSLGQELCSEAKKLSNIENEAKQFFREERNQAQQKSQNLIQTLLEKSNALLVEYLKNAFYKLQKTESRILALSQKKSILENAVDIFSCLHGGTDIRIFLELKKIKNALKNAKPLLREREEHMSKCSVSFVVSVKKLACRNSFGKITEHQAMSEPPKPHCSLNSMSWLHGLYTLRNKQSVDCMDERDKRDELEEWDESEELYESEDSQMSDSSSQELENFQFGGKTFSLSISIDVDDGNSHVTGCDWRSENEIVIVVQNVKPKKKSHICVYNTNDGILMSKIKLDKKPYCVATLSSNTCAITFPNEEEIRIYNLYDFSLKRIVDVGFTCFGVCCCFHSAMKQNVYVVAGNDTIALFHENLSEIRRLTVRGEDIRYITAYSNNLLFYSDLQGNAVYSTMGNGDNRFEYEENMKGPAGLILDEFKNVYICEKGESSIHVLSKSGSFLRKFEVSQNPTALSLSKNKKKLCVISGGRKCTNLADIYVSE